MKIKTTIAGLLMVASILPLAAQERIVKIDFESGSFVNDPNIPFDKPFIIQGEAGREIEFVKVNIYNAGKDFVIHSYKWNRYDNDMTETFNIVVPPVLQSNTKYDFKIITYKLLSDSQKRLLLKQIEERIRFFLNANLYFDGKNVTINKPKTVYSMLKELVNKSLEYQDSKNQISYDAPSELVYQELKNLSEFRFGTFLKKKNVMLKDSVANQLVAGKVDHITQMIIAELKPYISSQLVQHYRMVEIKSVSTDKEPYTLPVNFGIYSWDKTLLSDPYIHNINFTPGIGLTLPFNSKTRLAHKYRMLDSFGFSAGVLMNPVKDAEGNSFTTPLVNLPVYLGIGFRTFKVVRFNFAGVLLGEKGREDFNNLTVIPTIGVALELNLWLGVKK